MAFFIARFITCFFALGEQSANVPFTLLSCITCLESSELLHNFGLAAGFCFAIWLEANIVVLLLHRPLAENHP